MGAAGLTPLFGGRINPILNFAEAVQEKFVVSDGLFNELFQQKHFRRVDDGMDTMFESFHGRERLERIAEQNNCAMTAQVDSHALQSLECDIFFHVMRAKEFFHDDDLIMNLREARQKVRVSGRGMDFVTQLRECGFGGLKPFRG